MGRGREEKKIREVCWNGKIIANPDIVLREEFDHHAFLYDPDSGDTFPVNPVGAFIWKHLDGHHSVNALLEEIKQHFDDVTDSAEAHVRAFLQDLSERGFIRK